MSDCYIALDIGAGRGVKIGLFSPQKEILAESLFPIHQYAEKFEQFVADLSDTIDKAVRSSGRNPLAIGISAPGILSSTGAFQLFQNCPQYNGHNLKISLSQALNLPTEIENDANTGALAEWSVLKMELLYWVFGGGWGGAWISREGKILHPSHDWDGVDSSLHPTNEPGYSIGLAKWQLKSFFNQVNASFELFESNLEDEELPSTLLTGPLGNPDTLRAELILSGPGRCRLFRAVVGNDDFYTQFLDIHEFKEMTDPSVAGQHISKLSRMRVESAINTDRLYGKILAEASRILLKRAESDGLSPGSPICLGGKPSYALPYFGPSAQRLLGKMGFMYYLRPSVIDERGSNANMIGALVLAERALEGISSTL
ncbi:MAG: ROK family protein [Spirochaetales bacterium]|nr:ROK family protein [Spirochaetales bacterium]